MRQNSRPVLDLCRLAAALLVITIHTAPLSDVSAGADFFLTRILARVAVPYFFMLTGYFLEKGQWHGMGHTLGKTALIYAFSVLLYLPLNLYAGPLLRLAPGSSSKNFWWTAPFTICGICRPSFWACPWHGLCAGLAGRAALLPRAHCICWGCWATAIMALPPGCRC